MNPIFLPSKWVFKRLIIRTCYRNAQKLYSYDAPQQVHVLNTLEIRTLYEGSGIYRIVIFSSYCGSETLIVGTRLNRLIENPQSMSRAKIKKNAHLRSMQYCTLLYR